MRTFRWRDGGAMTDREIQADHVTFEHAHVVFRAIDGAVVLAVQNQYVSNLACEEVPDPAEPSPLEEAAYTAGLRAGLHAVYVMDEAALHGFTRQEVIDG